jgi:hypothetical protein
VNIRYRQTHWATCLAVVCFATVLLSTTVQAAHFCAFRCPDAQAALELDPAASGNPVCLICLMAPSISAIILVVAFFIMSRSIVFVSRLQSRPRPILDSFQLYIRPPPLA